MKKTTILDSDEIVTEIHVPTPEAGTQSAFFKFAIRKSIDFPIVNCAAMITSSRGLVDSARICLNAVHINPYRASKAEMVLIGNEINEANADAAGSAAVSDAKPLSHNGYMVYIAKTLIKRAVLSCRPH